jgi:hypothetical protein
MIQKIGFIFVVVAVGFMLSVLAAIAFGITLSYA